MTSAGEVPIGPDEYAALSAVAARRLLLTTNVGVRANARYTQPLAMALTGRRKPAAQPAHAEVAPAGEATEEPREAVEAVDQRGGH